MDKIPYGRITLRCKLCGKFVEYEMKDNKSTYRHDNTPYTELGHVCDPDNRILGALEIIKIQYYDRVSLYIDKNTSVVSIMHPPLAIDWSKDGNNLKVSESEDHE